MGGRSDKTRTSALTTRLAVSILVATYLLCALTFSVLTRAFEADDEQGHVQYVEYVVDHGAIPHISVANLQESHQPPLYYLLVAGWQDLLRIPAFTPVVVQEHYKDPYIGGRLFYSHNYTASQHRAAVDIHILRLLSVLLGLGTVLLTFAAAKVVGMREPVALSAGFFVALMPRFLVVSSVVTNDALVIPLCSLAIVLFLLSERARGVGSLRRRRLYVIGMGATLGAAAITKFNSLPIAVLLFILAAAPSIRVSARESDLKSKPAPVLPPDLLAVGRGSLSERAVSGSDATGGTESGQSRRHFSVDLRLLRDGALAVAGFIAVSGWWFVRNRELYGQFLATKASENYLRAFYLQPIPWSFDILSTTLRQTLLTSTWYTQPDEYLPESTNKALLDIAFVCLVAGAYFIFKSPTRRWHRPPILSGFALLGSIVAGIAAIVITIQASSTGNTRTAFVGLTGFAVLVVIGISRLAGRINPRLELAGLVVWPAALFALDLYVLVHVLIPLGGL